MSIPEQAQFRLHLCTIGAGWRLAVDHVCTIGAGWRLTIDHGKVLKNGTPHFHGPKLVNPLSPVRGPLALLL